MKETTLLNLQNTLHINTSTQHNIATSILKAYNDELDDIILCLLFALPSALACLYLLPSFWGEIRVAPEYSPWEGLHQASYMVSYALQAQ